MGLNLPALRQLFRTESVVANPFSRDKDESWRGFLLSDLMAIFDDFDVRFREVEHYQTDTGLAKARKALELVQCTSSRASGGRALLYWVLMDEIELSLAFEETEAASAEAVAPRVVDVDRDDSIYCIHDGTYEVGGSQEEENNERKLKRYCYEHYEGTLILTTGGDQSACLTGHLLGILRRGASRPDDRWQFECEPGEWTKENKMRIRYYLRPIPPTTIDGSGVLYLTFHGDGDAEGQFHFDERHPESNWGTGKARLFRVGPSES